MSTSASQRVATRILGLDPGLRITGFGLIDKTGNQLAYVASGCVKTDESASLPERIKTLLDGIAEVVAAHRPSQSAVEKVFVNVNPQSTLLLGQARGAALTALVNANLAVSEYTALQMKKAITGHGRAAKNQIQEMVKRLLQLPGLPGTDAADALGLAITHAHAAAAMGLMAKSTDLHRKQHAMYRAGRVY